MQTGGKELMMLLDEVAEGIYFTDRQRRITFWNKAAERISGYSRTEVLGRSCRENILIHVDHRGRSMCAGLCPLARTLRDGQARRGDIYLHHKDGHRVPVRVRVFPLRDEQRREIGAVELFTDASEKPALEARLEEFRRFGWPLGVVFFDIDDFKSLNDRFSHRIGDRALKTVARTLQHNIRSIDLAGRWGGEEFILILRNIDRTNLTRTAEKLRRLVERSVFWVQGEAVCVTLSGGATLARSGDTGAALVERADLLMYEGKKSGKNRVVCA